MLSITLYTIYSNLAAEPLNVRINSACFTGDIFGDSRCDCHWQMIEFLRIMHEADQGLLIYHMHHEGRANGVIAKLRSYKASDAGNVGRKAYESLGIKAESREYTSSAVILEHLKINRVRLFSNNPEKIKALNAHHIEIEETVQIKSPDLHFDSFYAWKRDHFGHMV